MNANEQIILFLLEENDGPNLNIVLNIAEDLAQPIDQNIEERAVVQRNRNYFEIIIPLYTDLQFKEHFRMSRGTFELLSIVVGNHLQNPNIVLPLQKKLLFTLWLLSKPESYLAAGDRFGLAKSTGHKVFKEIVSILAQLTQQYITWPNAENQQISSICFENRSHGFPGVVGAIDGCHIPCKQPVGNANDFYNRKGFHSIVLQGTCDHRARFIDVFIGMPGRMHDARIFRNSPLFRRMTDEANLLLPPQLHLIGDAAYPLMVNLMTPFRNNGHLSYEQVRFNTKLSSIRSIIERAFGLLKGKFRRLKYLDISDFELGNNIIAAACVLHNFIIDNNDINELEENFDDNLEDEPIFEDIGGRQGAAENKRASIVNIFQ